MAKKYDFKKEWPKIKKDLMRIKDETMVLAKKGKKELEKISIQGKMHIDLATLKLRKEHLFHLIGKEYVKAKPVEFANARVAKLNAELKNIDKGIKDLGRKIKSTPAGSKKKAA